MLRSIQHIPMSAPASTRASVRSLLVVVFAVLLALPTASAETMSGRWRGQWVSQTTGHKGPLNARFRPVDANRYRAIFTGRFAKVIPFRYGMTMQVQSRDADTIYFGGSRSLGLFGKFEYRARASGGQFVATYQSRRDRGRFEMRRQ